jgi:hypothetical protein
MRLVTKRRMYTVPVPSTGFTREAYFDGSQVKPAIRYEYQAGGKVVRGGICFRRVAATKHLGEPYCTAWHVADCYDVLVEIVESRWLNELNQNAAESSEVSDLHHYMIYLDSVGCFEIAAEGWETIQDAKV